MSSSTLKFHELYIALCRALEKNRGGKYKELGSRLNEARLLSGDSLTAMITQWYQQTKGSIDSFKSSDETVLTDKNVPACMASLHINDIFNDTTFNANSRKNLWVYLVQLIEYAQDSAADDLDACEPKSNFPFGDVSEEQLKELQKISACLSPDLMKSMHLIAEGYQRKISTGEMKIDSIKFADVLTDVIGVISETNMEEFMANVNVGGLVDSLKNSEIIKSMSQATKEK